MGRQPRGLTLRTVRDAGTNDLVPGVAPKISTGTSLADVRAEGAARLVANKVEARDVGVLEVEVLVPVGVFTKLRVIIIRREVNRSSLKSKDENKNAITS